MKGIYFINTPELGDLSLFKIGWSQDIDDRLKQLQTGNGHKLNLYKYILTTDRKLESEIHTSLKQYRKQGEWFDITECDVDKIVNQYDKMVSDGEQNGNIIEETEPELELVEEITLTKKVYKYKPYTCDICNTSFTAERYLTRHTKAKTCVKEYKCNKCQKEFTTAQNLRKHNAKSVPCISDKVPALDTDNATNMCKYCGKTYANTYSLSRHQKSCIVKSDSTILVDLLLQQQKNHQQEMAELKQQINILLQKE